MDKSALGPELLDYISREIVRQPSIELTLDSPLISSGLVDSFALLDLLLKVEEMANLRIPAGKVQPEDMDTVTLILRTVERVGKPKAS